MSDEASGQSAPRRRPGYRGASDDDGGGGGRSIPLDALGARASRIVEDAASILEEELANGIGVARNVEKRIFDKRGPSDPDAVVSRFRQDAHEIIDLAVDLLGGALGSVTGLANRAVAIRDPAVPEAARSGRVPTLTMSEPVAAGSSGDVAMSVENDSDQATETFTMNASDLISGAGDRIPANRIAFDPPSLKVDPREAEKITVLLTVPPKTPPGTYSGLLQATKLEPVRAVLVVTVT